MKFYLLDRVLVAKLISHQPLSKALQEFEISALGVTLTYSFSMTNDISNVIANCARLIYALRILRRRGMSPPTLRAIFQSTVLAKLTYAVPAWWAFANSAEQNPVEAFIRHQNQQLCPLHPNCTLCL